MRDGLQLVANCGVRVEEVECDALRVCLEERINRVKERVRGIGSTFYCLA